MNAGIDPDDEPAERLLQSLQKKKASYCQWAPCDQWISGNRGCWTRRRGVLADTVNAPFCQSQQNFSPQDQQLDDIGYGQQDVFHDEEPELYGAGCKVRVSDNQDEGSDDNPDRIMTDKDLYPVVKPLFDEWASLGPQNCTLRQRDKITALFKRQILEMKKAKHQVDQSKRIPAGLMILLLEESSFRLTRNWRSPPKLMGTSVHFSS